MPGSATPRRPWRLSASCALAKASCGLFVVTAVVPPQAVGGVLSSDGEILKRSAGTAKSLPLSRSVATERVLDKREDQLVERRKHVATETR